MFALFRALTEGVKALFATNAALDFEAELLARDAERKAELLRQADRYQDEGLDGIAQHLRRQAENLSLQRPLAGVLPAIEHLKSDTAQPLLLRLAAEPDQPTPTTLKSKKRSKP